MFAFFNIGDFHYAFGLAVEMCSIDT
jgi:hypothetical protein